MRENVPLSSHSYYKIGGPAQYFAEPESDGDLTKIAEFLKTRKVPYFILGAGSNVLFDDRGFDGLVLHTGKLNRTIHHEGDRLTLGCSVTVAQALRYCGNHGLGGLEFLVGVPGNIGGVCYMNAGTKTGEASAAVESVTVFNLSNGMRHTYDKDKIHYAYRTQKYLAPHDIVLEATFRVQPASRGEIQERITSMLTTRKAAQPIDKPSCGSVFKNPDPEKNIYAWKVVADCGFRGKIRGGAQVSEMHTNFIVNNGGAKSSDVRGLIEDIKGESKIRFGIQLEEEVKIIPYNGTCFVN